MSKSTKYRWKKYKVSFEHKGNLYIDMGDYIIRKINPFDYVPKEVELIYLDKEFYIKGFEPKINTKEKTNKKKVK